MIKIRNSRLKKSNYFNGTWVNFIKVISIMYVLVITCGYLTSYTSAYFNDTDQATISIKSPVLIWDKSSLEFPNENRDQVVNSGNPVNISVAIKNNGSNMAGTTKYEVYYIESGNPKQGVKVASGTINPINSNQTATLTYLASKPGEYKFRAFQRPGHNYDFENRKDLWSETISVVSPEKPIESSSSTVKQEPAAPADQQNQADQAINESTNTTSQETIEQPITEPEKSTANQLPTETTDKPTESN